LKRIDVDGGRLQTLADVPVPQGGTWNRDGVILFAPDYPRIYKISATGGTPVLVKEMSANTEETGNYAPAFLSDGKRFLYWVQSRKPDVTGVYAGSLDDPKLKTKLAGITSWATPVKTSQGVDYLMWVRGDTVVAQPWDSSSIRLTGEPVPLGGPVGVLGSTPEIAVSENGLLVYGAPVELQLTWVDRTGKTLSAIGEPGFISSLRISPDGRKVAYRNNSPSGSLFIADLLRGTSSRITMLGISPEWSPDGSEVAYVRTRQGVDNVVLRRADGSGDERPVVESPNDQQLIGWLQDGMSILYYESVRDNQLDLRVAGIAPGSKPRVVRSSNHGEPEAAISPDGRWLAYASDQSNRLEIYIEPFKVQTQEREQRWQVSSKGGSFPRWRPDGQELFYVSSDGELMSVEIRTKSESLELSPPQSLFSLPAVFNGNYAYDVAGPERFLVSAVSSRRGKEPLSVIVNWPAFLSRK
jgi:Tol biopolymer transport system component